MRRTHAKSHSDFEVALKYLPFLRSLTRRMVRKIPAHVDFEDMLSVGTLGLFDSLRKYDPSKSERFESYAEFRIKGAILDELRACDPLSREQRAQVSAMRDAHQRLGRLLGREPSSEEIAAELGYDLDQLHAVSSYSAATRQVPLDDLMHGGSGEESPFLAAKTEPQAEQHGALLQALSRLPSRLRLILRLYYFDDMNLKEIGRVMNVTESRICQLHRQAIEELKALLAEMGVSADAEEEEEEEE